jgi:hypothetical protein
MGISAYFADRSILLFLIRDSKAVGKLKLADVYLTVEPYALALPRGDEDFRLEVDRAPSATSTGRLRSDPSSCPLCRRQRVEPALTVAV